MVSQLQMVSTVDLYYICQMVDGVTRNPMAYFRNIDDIFGDMLSESLARSYPRWTCFHIFVEELISSVVLEDAGKLDKNPGEYWVDHLLASNGLESTRANGEGFDKIDGYEYLDILNENNLVAEVCEVVAKQVFHVLFSNRGTMAAFGGMVYGHVLETSSSFSPDAFNHSGHLKRTSIPTWAKNAIFHRDKGHCVLCQTDLTNLFSQQAQLHYDHINPLAQGGMNCVTNLQLTCSTCNLGKGGGSSDTSHDYEAWYDY